MRTATGWQDYELVDASAGRRLERWGDFVLVRPDPQVVWRTDESNPLWRKADAWYHRSDKGGGAWEYRRRLPSEWMICWDERIKMYVTPTGFKHTGVFPEQAANWVLYEKCILQAGRSIRVLNLFGYTGGATVACLRAGASVCHVDASKGMVGAARRNVELNGMSERETRYIVDDCSKFVAREKRRGSRYDAIIMDPPSYGRGPNGEMWRLEDCVFDLVSECRDILTDNPLFFALNSYTAGLAPSAMGYVVATAFSGFKSCRVESEEIGIPVSGSGLALPCGATTLALF